MRILETWSTNCSLIVINACVYHLFLKIKIDFVDHSFTSGCEIWIETLSTYPWNGVGIKICLSSWVVEVGEVLSFFPLMEPHHLRTHCHCSMMMNLQTLASLFVVQIVVVVKKVQTNPPKLSLEVTCGPFCGWNLQHLVQVASTLKKAWVTYLPFCDWNHQDHFLIWLSLTSFECHEGCNISNLLTVLTLAWTKVLIEVVIERFDPFGGFLLLLL